jgi:hypothetical protein
MYLNFWNRFQDLDLKEGITKYINLEKPERQIRGIVVTIKD